MSVTKNYKEMVKAANIDGLICYYTQVYVNKYYDLYSEQLDIKGLDYKSEYRLKAARRGSGRTQSATQSCANTLG